LPQKLGYIRTIDETHSGDRQMHYDQEQIDAQAQQAASIMGANSDSNAVVVATRVSKNARKFRYGFRFDPTNALSVGDDVEAAEGAYQKILAVVPR